MIDTLLDRDPLVPTTDSTYPPTDAPDVAESVSAPEVEPPGGGVRVPGAVTVTPVGAGPTHVV